MPFLHLLTRLIVPLLAWMAVQAAPDDTVYSVWWAAARADSFHPARDLMERRWRSCEVQEQL